MAADETIDDLERAARKKGWPDGLVQRADAPPRLGQLGFVWGGEA